MGQMKLILSQYKLIVQSFKHHDLEKVLSKGSSCTILKRRVLKESWHPWKKKIWAFLKKLVASPIPLVERLFLFLFFKWHKFKIYFENFLHFFFGERFGNLNFCIVLFFVFCFLFILFFCFFLVFNEQCISNTTWNFRIWRNREQTNKL